MTDSNTPEKNDTARREEEILAFWNERRIFEKTLEKDAPNGEFVFYDGPPFATGLPHHGHILAGTIKDTIPRYQTMRGKRVRRRWGWDCHGLPLENLIEKRLGLKTKKDIEELGVETFNRACADAVVEYVDDWKKIVPRLGRWADMEHDYKTMDPTYTESVWWVFSELNRKGLVYEGFKSMHLCPRCGTTLSNFEVNLGYKDIKDISVTVKLELVDEPGTHLLVWTTTPWTLPGNMAAAVHEEYDYVKVRVAREDESSDTIILAKARLAAVVTEPYEILAEFKGKELVGKSYKPPFDYFANEDIKGKENAWKIYHAPYVELGEEGTGAVHLAPAYGDEDMALAKERNIPIVHHVGADGRFLPLVTDFSGQLVKPKDDESTGVTHLDADIAIVKALKEKGLLFKKENITHSYPLCWRCDTPLLNYATTSWFVRVTDITDDLVSENSKVHWVPDHVGSARFGNWLLNARDWAISRQRYWGAPLPIWKNQKTGEYKVFGSLADLAQWVPKSGNTYTLMRHGEAESNAKGVSSTKFEARNPLTEKGRGQVTDAAQTLKNEGIDVIIASPFERTRMTAEIVASACGIEVSDIVFDERLGEIQFGVLDGSTAEEYHAFLGDGRDWGRRTPEGGEAWQDVKRRVGAVLYDLEARYAGKKVLIIAHNSPLRMLCAVAKGESLNATFDHDKDGQRFDNAEIRSIDFTPLPHNREYELDFHRPYIDEIALVDGDGTPLVRVPDVFDCWFESGSMPYGQQHYPFENTDIFEPSRGVGYPADFIAEGLDQTRGWFYSLIVLGTALFGQSPYKNVIVNGLVLAEDGKKMSKSLKNYPDPMDIVERYGADTLRFYLLSSSIIKGEDLNFTEKHVAELGRKNIGRLANVLSFYELYKDDTIDPAEALASKNPLDLWVRARLSELITEVTSGMDSYELDRATRPVTEFIDDLSVWYVRRSRDRVKSDDATDRRFALATLRHTLRTLALVVAPSMPFFAEHLFLKVKTDRDPESVHLAEWPQAGDIDTDLIATMSFIRSFVTMGLMARERAKVGVKQPLQSFTIRHNGLAPRWWSECEYLLKDELNVKEIVLSTDESQAEPAIDFDWEITPALRAEGEVRELMRHVQDMRKEKGLSPEDRIVLRIDTDTEGRAAVEAHQERLVRTVNASEVVFESVEGEELTLPGRTYRAAIE